MDQFQEYFRMRPCTFETLSTIVAEEVDPSSFKIPLEKKMLYTIWLISKPESFLAASDQFGIGSSTGHYSFLSVPELVPFVLVPLKNRIRRIRSFRSFVPRPSHTHSGHSSIESGLETRRSGCE